MSLRLSILAPEAEDLSARPSMSTVSIHVEENSHQSDDFRVSRVFLRARDLRVIVFDAKALSESGEQQGVFAHVHLGQSK